MKIKTEKDLTGYCWVILTITFSTVMATSCQNNSGDQKTTETLAETRQIPDYGMAMVTIGNTEKASIR